MLDEQGNEIELKDEDEDDFIPELKDELYAADDEELADSGFSIENAPEDDFGADFGLNDDYNDEEDQ